MDSSEASRADPERPCLPSFTPPTEQLDTINPKDIRQHQKQTFPAPPAPGNGTQPEGTRAPGPQTQAAAAWSVAAGVHAGGVLTTGSHLESSLT